MFHLLESKIGALVGTNSILCGQIWDILCQGLQLRLFLPIFIYFSEDKSENW